MNGDCQTLPLYQGSGWPFVLLSTAAPPQAPGLPIYRRYRTLLHHQEITGAFQKITLKGLSLKIASTLARTGMGCRSSRDILQMYKVEWFLERGGLPRKQVRIKMRNEITSENFYLTLSRSLRLSQSS